MSNSKQSEEVDLGVLFNGIKSIFKRMLILLYRFIQFCLKSWAILLALLIIGIVGGYFWQQSDRGKQEAVLIVRINFQSSSYVYSAIEQLNASLYEKDATAELPEIYKIEIEPVINIEQLFEDFENEMVVIEMVEIFQDKKGAYSPEAFVPRYKFHKIEVVFNENASEESIQKLISYLSKNPLLQEIKEIGLQNLQQRLVDNKKMVSQIDELLKSISTSEALSSNSFTILPGNAAMPLDRILEFKKELLEENDEIRENILAQQELVVLINKPRMVVHNPLLANKVLLLPLLLIFSFFGISFLIWMYRKMGKMARNQ